MPLIRSAKPKAVSLNIATERAAGKPERQAVAIGLSVADHAKGKKPERHPRNHAEFLRLGDD